MRIDLQLICTLAELNTSDIKAFLFLLFETYALYIDRPSRRAAQSCLRTTAASPRAVELLPDILESVKSEATKPGIAPANAFVLVEWCSILLEEFASQPALWQKWGLTIVLADAQLLETCMGSDTRFSVKHSALVVTRRALRKLFRSPKPGKDAVGALISSLTSKAQGPTARNAVLLGIVAGVSARLPAIRPEFETKKKDCYAFYTREIIGSRTVLPPHIANALGDLFESFTTLEDLKTDLMPAIEKSLLRAPEVVLNDLVTPMIQSLRSDIDLSSVLQTNLLKPFLSNIKSTNPTIRSGALKTFQVVALRSSTEVINDKVADEILTPLKQNKVTAADQRALHTQMLASLNSCPSLVDKIATGLLPLALKEANESALESEIQAISKHLSYAFSAAITISSAFGDTFAKGIADKRPAVRRIWSLWAGDALWDLSADMLKQNTVVSFVQAILPKLIDALKEVIANPLPSAQNGLCSVAYVLTAISLSTVQKINDANLNNLVEKSAIAKQVLVGGSKPSFLLNHRIYSKIIADSDLNWGIRALTSTAKSLAEGQPNSDVEDGWSQAFLYFITSSIIPPTIRKEAAKSLANVYLEHPARIGHVVIDGIWNWRRKVDLDEKDTAAASAKTGNSELYHAIRSITPSHPSEETQSAKVDLKILENQLIDLLVLDRPELLPHTSWIETCLRVGIDPRQLVDDNIDNCLKQVKDITEGYTGKDAKAVHQAAYRSVADLAFVAPEMAIPLIVQQLSSDLDCQQLHDVGPTEAAIFRTPEGTAYIDVLASQSQTATLRKNAKDYDSLLWEEELRAELAKKSGQKRKLTADEQSKVNAQIAKESTIRKGLTATAVKLRRGIGIIRALATGPPTERELWIVQAIHLLTEVIEAGAGLILGDTATSAYLDCATAVTSRVGALRPFIGIATLRAIGVTQISNEYLAEPLSEQVTRVLYRLRFLAEQRTFDVVSLAYMLPLVFLTLENGGFAETGSEEADEQLVLALEFLSLHSNECANIHLPREKLLSAIISSMQSYNQHYRLIRDCLQDLCRNIEPTITDEEVAILVKGTIVPQPTVREAVLQAIDSELDLSDMKYSEQIWLACHDDIPENVQLARDIWEESDFAVPKPSAAHLLSYLESSDRSLRRSAARTLAETVVDYPDLFDNILSSLMEMYKDKAKPREPQRDKYGMPLKIDLSDPWEARSGVALAFRELAIVFTDSELVPFTRFLIDGGPLGDRNPTVREEMMDAATVIIAAKGSSKVEELMHLFETTLETPNKGSEFDKVNEAVVILYGALARHLKAGDKRVPTVVQRLLSTLSTPSETVQYAVSECLPPLVQASIAETGDYVQQMLDELLKGKKYASRRGAAYGLAGIVRGKGITALREYRIMATFKGATENKKDANQRQGAFLAYELLSLILDRLFEPYVIQIVPQLLAGFGDANIDVREACLDASKACFSKLSSYGVKQILPTLLEGLEEDQWRSKKGACDLLGAMAYLDPQQLALSLPQIIPPLTTILNDSHKEVRASAKRSLQRFGDVISNPEIKSVVDVLLKALSDPTKFTDEALDSLIKIQFLHFLDAPSLALVVRILERGLGDRSATKRKSAQIIGSLAHLTERKDLVVHLPILVAGLRVAIVDPVPATRATASKALGSTIEKLGEDALPDLIPSLMATLKSDTGAGDRLGSAQALSEVLAGLGTTRLEETLPTILQNVSSSKPAVREGFMCLFIFLPACFGNSFSNYLNRVIPPILGGLADEVESIRETALRAGRLLVKNFANRAIDLLLPELERGLADDSYRIRLSSVELVGDLLFSLTGITAKAEGEEEEVEESAQEAGQSLLEVLGQDRRDKILSAIYICRCDTSGLVRSAAIAVWKALVASPRTLREITHVLTQLIIRRLANSNMEQKVIAGNALGELIRKAGEGILANLLPTLQEGLESTDMDLKQGTCMALRELISSASPEALEDYEKTLIALVRTAIVDSNPDVREAAAEAFDSLQHILGKKAVDQVLPHLLNLLRNEDEAENALSALLTLLTDTTRSNIILPNLLPTLLTSPMSSFNAKALASLAEVASSSMTRRLPNILNSIMDNIVNCKDDERLEDLNAAFDSVLLSVDEFDGLNTAMSVVLTLIKHDDHRRRRIMDTHLATFLAKAEIDISRYYPDLIRVLLIAFDDSDKEVVKAAWEALNELTKRLRKEEMESLVIPTRQVLQQVGVPGSDLPGFSLPKGINAILPIFLQGLMNGTSEQRTQSALAISDIIDRTGPESLKPFVTNITGPLIRVISERSVEVKGRVFVLGYFAKDAAKTLSAAILYTLNNLLEKIPTYLKPFLPQLQRTFAKSLADSSSDILRIRAAKALGTLITMTPRVDPLIAELVTGSKTPDAGVKNAMLKALYEVVSKAGGNMNEASRNSILSLIDSDAADEDDAMVITHARLLGALIKVLPEDAAANLIKHRVLTTHFSKPSVLALNAILAESPESLTESFGDETVAVICAGIKDSQTVVSENAILAAGKYFLTPSSTKDFETCKPIFEAMAPVIAPGNPIDIRRLSLVVIRTVSRHHNDLVRPHLPIFTPPIFASVRDLVIPVKLAAEAAFLAIFSVVDEDASVFEKYLAGPGASLAPPQKRMMQDYFKRVAMRLAQQARERREAEGGQGALGLSSDEVEDEREVWSVGKVDLGEGGLGGE